MIFFAQSFANPSPALCILKFSQREQFAYKYVTQ